MAVLSTWSPQHRQMWCLYSSKKGSVGWVTSCLMPAKQSHRLLLLLSQARPTG